MRGEKRKREAASQHIKSSPARAFAFRRYAGVKIRFMPNASKVDEEIALLEKRRDELEKRLKAAQERRRKQELRREEKRQLVIGEIVLRQMRGNPDDELTASLTELLAKNVAAPDRALFPALAAPDGAAPVSASDAPKPVAGSE
jgi:hypothetical protein